MEIDVGEFDRMLGEARRALESVRATPAQDAEEIRDIGEAADGHVRVVFAGGRVESVQFDPRVMRMASAELAEHVATAANAALSAASARVAAYAGSIAGIDTHALAAQVERIQDQSLRQMAAMTEQLATVVARVRQSAG